MNWFTNLSTSERQEIFEDGCEAFSTEVISESDFRKILIELNYNATDIEDLVKEYNPPAPENYDGGAG